jgi:perosamine synthetase
VIRIAAPHLAGREREYVTEAVASGWISSRGPFVERFEQAFAAFCGARHGVASASGTTALHLALAALRLGPGDEVIVPAFTMIGTVNPVRYVGATPVVADVSPDSWNLTPQAVAAALSPRTRAIIVTHVYGHPADVEAIAAAAPGIPIVEDAAEAHGAECRGRRTGSLGRIAAFSFYANKILTTGEGGMVVTGDDELAERCRSLRDHAFGPDASRYEHDEVGFSYRMSNLQAAVGLAQTERADDLVERSRRLGMRYREGLQGLRGVRCQTEPAWARHVYWAFGIVIEDAFGMSRDELRASLEAAGIETRDFFHPIHHQPAYATMLGGARCPTAEELGRRGLYLPSGPGRPDGEVDAVVAALRRIAATALPPAPRSPSFGQSSD